MGKGVPNLSDYGLIRGSFVLLGKWYVRLPKTTLMIGIELLYGFDRALTSHLGLYALDELAEMVMLHHSLKHALVGSTNR